ncbi:helix-turn-helix domain-containing protein [Halorhabdus amylolytica]|uniref:helix-turn-helix domain-containing protein n=1 Tax=Halorhabdus amylolytica TaxID=2559573 RepID=UPI0010AB15B7|nr:helix-turn-helix domain-containing protein [Halorhabdus amylolytica]
MVHATLTLSIPRRIWIGALSMDHPDSRIRVLSAFPKGEESGVGLVEVDGPDVAGVVTAIDDEETVTDLAVLGRHDETALVQFETTDPLLLFPIVGSGIPLELPFDICDGQARWELTASQDRLSELGDQLETLGISFTVEQLRQHVEAEQVLTDRQTALVTEAIDRGYYDTPRECTLTELADAMDMAKSTCSETLHRAEEKIIKGFFEDEPTASARRGL